ncbi:MAG TPA: class I SAM-dependent methyltransferase, partial [Actinobacteria bacterium]|nr:class I SAM-dependent methyltransferase [Actinomycetota bacterium]
MSRVTVKDKEELMELPFDQFQRYKTVSEFADSIHREDKGPLKILDVGGYPGLITDFLPDDDITIVDVVPGDMPNYHQTKGGKLPFEDASFDLVCSCDTLEHVPAPDRQAFILELARVSKDYLLIPAPFD